MSKTNYQDIYVENMLRKIRAEIKKCYIDLDKEKSKKTDNLMKEVLKEVYTTVKEKQTVLDVLNLVSEKDKKSAPQEKLNETLVLYYYALYNDNIDLLQQLLASDFSFYASFNSLELSVLDERISKKIPRDLYLHLVKNQSKIISNFYSSLRSIDKEDPEKAEKLRVSFANILTKNPNVTERAERRHFASELYEKLLTADVIDSFDEDYLINAQENQKELINNTADSVSNVKIKLFRIKQLLEDYPKFSSKIILTEDILKMLTNKEIYEMSETDIEFYNYALFQHTQKQAHELLRLNPDFTKNLKNYDFMGHFTFEILDVDTILSLSNKALEEIGNIVFNKKHIEKNIQNIIVKKKLEE